MFNFKSQLLGAAVLGTALIASAGSAQAAGLGGGFNYSDSFGTKSGGGIGATIGKINSSLIDFVDPSVANLSNQFGDFTVFNGAKLYDINYNPLTPNPSLFMDLATGFPTTPGGPETPDGKNIFSLTSFDDVATIEDFGTGANFTYKFKGIFDKDGVAGGNDTSFGAGYITFAASYGKNGVKNLSQLKTKYEKGSIDTSFTGLAVTSVPEPTTMVGLGLVAAGMTVARRRKLVKA